MKNVLLFLMVGLSLASLGALEVTVTDKDLDLPLEGVIIQGTGLRAETDSQGTAVLDLPSESLLVTFSLPGYDTRRITLKKSLGTFKVELRVSGLLEGKELVVEKAAPQKSDSQTGVAVAVTRQEMQATAQMGIVEDVMSAVKTLPGVGYTGGWNAAPSIRGGHPLETTAWMDGFEVRYPYHWGGAFSIFNPNLVENAKLSAGLVSARYGRILSGLLEITTKTPEGRDLRFDASLTTTGLEGFLQLPFTDNAGVLLGGKYSWMEVSFGLAGQAGSFNQVPYIRDAYGKAYWNPSDRLKLFVNGFFGTDGVGAKNDSTGTGLTTTSRFDWFNRSLIVSGGLKWLPTDSLHILLQGGWNGHDDSPVSKSTSAGTQNYSQAFLDKYDGSALDADGSVNGLIAGKNNFDLAGTYFNFTGKDTNDNGQARLEAQWNLAPGHSVVAGAEGSLFLSRYLEDLDGYMDFSQGGQDLYAPFLWKLENPSNYTLNSGSFLLWDFSLADDRLTGELGVRGDYTYLWNPDMSLKTVPAVNPRLRTSWTALKNEGDFRNLTFTLGGGLFSKPVFFTQMFKKDFGLQDWDFGQDRNALALLGAEAELQGGWKFSLEVYGKYYFSRHYLTMVPESNPMEIAVQKDGIGWVGGFDLLIQKKEGRWFDGYLTYSFIWARYLNPTGQGSEAIQPNGEPINQWYFPNYHRFHNLNLIGNFKPTNWLTLSLKGALASGAPRREVGTPEVYAARMPDGQLVERWKRTSVYSDSLRNDLSCPVDIKISISDYYPDSKVRWEYYFGVENVFASFYTPKTTKALDGFTGQEMTGSGEAEFTIGAPIPSFGYKLSY